MYRTFTLKSAKIESSLSQALSRFLTYLLYLLL